MKIKFLSAMALCALLASCGGNANNNSNRDAATTADSLTIEQPAAAEKKAAPKKDWAMDFMKVLDRKYFPKEITQADFDEAFNTDYRQDEETEEYFPLFQVMNGSDGCYTTSTVYTFPKKDGKSCLVLMVDEAGCDGSSSTGVKAFSFDGKNVSEVECPLVRPSFGELTAGISDPDLNSLKREYNSDKGLEGLDIRLENGNIEIRPGQLGYDNLYEQFTPAVYTFNGETLVKK
ncbi:MAG: hypothetical protein MJZ66_08385 [Bacteroidales bacterium]|nr:hypothetical protein [Bacteroidales bacterium]